MLEHLHAKHIVRIKVAALIGRCRHIIDVISDRFPLYGGDFAGCRVGIERGYGHLLQQRECRIGMSPDLIVRFIGDTILNAVGICSAHHEFLKFRDSGDGVGRRALVLLLQ